MLWDSLRQDVDLFVRFIEFFEFFCNKKFFLQSQADIGNFSNYYLYSVRCEKVICACLLAGMRWDHFKYILFLTVEKDFTIVRRLLSLLHSVFLFPFFILSVCLSVTK